jgi:hypothetical protein
MPFREPSDDNKIPESDGIEIAVSTPLFQLSGITVANLLGILVEIFTRAIKKTSLRRLV